ncbi:MAG: hypothetical protein Sapg2KO_07290 [Saprospiraceae bacterium]
MNRLSLFLLLTLILSIFSCVNDQSAKEADLKPNERSFPKSERAILKMVSNIEEHQDTMSQNGPMTILRDGKNIEVTAFLAGNAPMLVEAQYPEKQEFYFLKDLQLMMLKELIFQAPDSSLIIENQFFYSQSKLVGMRTRSAEALEALKFSSFSPIKTEGTDYRFVAEKANQSAANFIYGQ